jgi:hypothetical protein
MSDIPAFPTLPAYYTGVHNYAFRAGQQAEIIGVRMMVVNKYQEPVLMVLYEDGFVDYVSIRDKDSFAIGTKKE